MKGLDKRKMLAAKILGVGKRRIVFDSSKLSEIKEAITSQDIRDLHTEGIISIKPEKGRRKHEKRTTKRGTGKIKRKLGQGKEKYMILVRKLRMYVQELRKHGRVDEESYLDLRKKIKAKMFGDKAHIKEHIESVKGAGVKK